MAVFRRNLHGIRVKVCCASCDFRKAGSRECKIFGSPEAAVQGGPCPRYLMRNGLMHAGARGKRQEKVVFKPMAYFRFLADWRKREDERERAWKAEGRPPHELPERASIEEIRGAWGRATGSRL
ncbi:MAG: hypothetical protein ACI3YD_04380 [Alloprevotella sp.]